MDREFDLIVIGAGIAGASVAAELATTRRVLLLEREPQPGYHTTGRSAALYTVAYGPPVIRALSRASGGFFRDPRSPFVSHPLLTDRGAVFIARDDQVAAMQAFGDALGDAVSPLSRDEMRRRIPLLRPDHCAAGLFDASAADIDVAALHQHYLKSFRAAGGQIRTGAEVLDLAQGGAGWQVETGSGVFSAATVVNAAGAWADEIAQRAGLAQRGLVPKRRTAMIIAAPEGTATERWPMVIDVDEQFYLKPEAGKFLISPADETPSPPCDAQPEEIDVAICVDRIERAFDMRVHRIESKWAGLRSFLPDGNPLAGYDPAAPGFFWLAGQGGYGIQTAPALARAAAALISGVSLPDDIARAGVTPALLSGGLQGVAA